MKYKNIVVFIAMFTFLGALSSYGLTAKAEDNNKTDDETAIGVSASIQVQNEVNFEAEKKQMEASREAEKKTLEGASESVKKEAEIKWESEKKAFETSRENYNNGTSTKEEDNDNGTTTKEKDEDDWDDDANEHRSAVSIYVHGLLDIASTTRDKGIGERVRIVAKEQNDNKDKTSRAINDVKSRNAFIIFLIGADFKNLGELRSSIVTTDNHINRLNDIKSKASSTPEIQTALDVEIKALIQEKDRLTNIVAQNEKRGSLFGWLVKLFQ